MELLILLLIFTAIGFLLAESRFGRKVDQAANRVTTTSSSWASRAEDWVRGLFGRRKPQKSFQAWATTGPGAKLMPEDFKEWLAGLSEQEASNFTQALSDYADGLGYSLTTLVEGGLDQQPILRQVFVEAITVYSQAYRKARQVREAQAKQAEAAKGPEAEAAPSGDGKKPAEKRPAGRSAGDAAVESAESAPAA
jgi:hypothetical protein